MLLTNVKKSSIIMAIVTALVLLFALTFGTTQVHAAQSKGQTAATYAKKLVNKPYKWGGTTTKGFDASGFTQYVYSKSLKVKLSRTSVSQYKAGKSVAKNKLQPGDLVFYKTSGKNISFVGIYIGKNQFIGATSKGVRILSMDASYWKKLYVGAKRVVN